MGLGRGSHAYAPRQKAPADAAQQDKAAKEIEVVADFYERSPESLKEVLSGAVEICKDTTITSSGSAGRRYSDQFRQTSNRLYAERKKNKQARVVARFKAENRDIEEVTERWKEILVSAIEEITRDESISLEGVYAALSLQEIGISKEDVGLD